MPVDIGSSVVFLDIDGVLLPFGAGAAGGGEFPDACLAAFSHILEQTGAQVVLSSTWRCDEAAVQIALGQFRAYGDRCGGPLAIVTFAGTTSTTHHGKRDREIDEWLHSPEAAGVEAWVALDDEPLQVAGFEGHVVQTDSPVGLMAEDGRRAVAMLRRQWAEDWRGRTPSANLAGKTGCIGPVPKPLPLERNLSVEFSSRGSSRYSEAALQKWQGHRDRAAAAMRREDWAVVAVELRHAVSLRPDWSQGHIGLYQALAKLGEKEEARLALRSATAASLAGFRRTLESGRDAEGITHEAMTLSGKAAKQLGADAPSVGLGTATRDGTGDALLLYRSVSYDAPWLAGAPRPLRLLFLDVDGVLNTAGSANSGVLSPILLQRLQQLLDTARAVVVLSSSWRSFDELRPLALGCLPPGRVVGQTPHGFENHVRPREIFDVLRVPAVESALGACGASWAAVDDMDLLSQAQSLATSDGAMKGFLPELQKRFVRTDKSIGLDLPDAALLAQILTQSASA